MNNYIVTNFGFVKEITFDMATLKHTIEYTDKIRYAKAYKTKAAKALMESHDIIGFIYNPFGEEPIRNMYEVRKRSSYSIMENHDEVVEEWRPVKAFCTSDSDVGFLQSRKLKSKDYLTYEQALAKAIELNTEMLHELNDKIMKQTNEAFQKAIDGNTEEHE